MLLILVQDWRHQKISGRLDSRNSSEKIDERFQEEYVPNTLLYKMFEIRGVSSYMLMDW